MTSKDGFQWTPKTGLVKGVPTIGAISPKSNIKSDATIYDVIVVGAGYCGLTAAREAAIGGLQVLLVEARDRIGGRSWSSNIGGYPFEMGGTWVTWGQSHVWREISRYQMQDELEISQDYSSGAKHCCLSGLTGKKNISHDEEDALVESGLRKFVNVDGQYGRGVMPFPHSLKMNPLAAKYDSMTAADRMAQIQDSLTQDEYTALVGFILLCSGGTLDNMSFYEFLKWWALSNYSYEYAIEYLVKYKFHGGQSSFAIRFFEEALDTGNLSYVFDTPVKEIHDLGNSVKVTARNGSVFEGAQVVSAMPLNTLNDVVFSPRLSQGKKAATNMGHINQCVKVHAEVRNKDLRSWSTITYNPKDRFLYAFGDGTTPSNNTHIVAFGSQYNHLQPDDDIDVTLEAMQSLVSMDAERLVFHNWSKDEFAKGAWFFPTAGLVTKYLEDLRASEGRVHFANSDWARGWRSFIDGAIEEGTRAARTVMDLHKLQVSKKRSKM
ncbi:amine oxidase [Lophiostoma macrostomum CBS 122681]|uniref:Amine oxidase n=1 Tax=Lophiostoma macrostomum CBS 122681 TaxID=1314788 RepID=A0A6A6SSI9_9PLEO|nr:amine oxidase [Lophiostoma macrostomum CBS 122681]